MKKIATFALVFASATLSLPLLAADKTQGSGPSPYTECGIGAALFPNTPVGAVISNVIWDIGTTAITSAISSPQTCNGKKVAAATLIFDTYTSIEEEAALGAGENLTSALTLLGCDAASQGAILEGIQADFGASSVSATSNRLQKSEQLYNIIQTNANKSGSCQA